jgi:hypothetical protein
MKTILQINWNARADITLGVDTFGWDVPYDYSRFRIDSRLGWQLSVDVISECKGANLQQYRILEFDGFIERPVESPDTRAHAACDEQCGKSAE